MWISAQGRAVLETLSQQPRDCMAISRLVDLLQPAHGSLASTRASVSRSLRRLWRAGLVELENNRRQTLTEQLAVLDAVLAAHEADPEAEYARVLEGVPHRWPAVLTRGSAEGYLAYRRQTVAREKRSIRSAVVVLTAQRQEFLTVDTVNSTPGIVNRNSCQRDIETEGCRYKRAHKHWRCSSCSSQP